MRFRYLSESDDGNGPFINLNRPHLVDLYEVIRAHVNMSRRIYHSCSVITLYISETKHVLMDTPSCNFLLSYCESLFHYGLHPRHTCYPSLPLILFIYFYCKALIMLEILSFRVMHFYLKRIWEISPNYSVPYSGLRTITATSQVFVNFYHLFLQESMEVNRVMDWAFASPAFPNLYEILSSML